MSTVIRLKRGETGEEIMVQEPTNHIIGQPLLRFVEDEPSYIYTFDGKIDNKFIFTRFGSDIVAGKGVRINVDGNGYYDNETDYVVNFRKINVNITSPLYINSSNQIAINVGPGLGIINNQLVANGSSYEEGLNIEIDNDDLIHSFRFVAEHLSNPAPQLSDGSYNLIGPDENYGITPTLDKVSTYIALKINYFDVNSNHLVINLFDHDFNDDLIQENVIHHISVHNMSPEVFKIDLRAITSDPNFKMINVTNNSIHAAVDNTVNISGKICYYLQSVSYTTPNQMAELSFIKYQDADGSQIISITHT